MTKEEVYDLSFNTLDLTKEERAKILLDVGVLSTPSSIFFYISYNSYSDIGNTSYQQVTLLSTEDTEYPKIGHQTWRY